VRDRFRGRTVSYAVGLLLASSPSGALPVSAQEPATLTLQEALTLARRNNPEYLAQRNDEAVADWAVREAYGALLPGGTASTSFGWQGAGTQRFGIFTGEDLGIASSTSYYSSSYSLGLNYRLSGASLLAPGREKASRRATEANIEAAALGLDAAVSRQYLMVLRAQDGVTLAQQELQRARENLKYAEARVAVGAAISLESKQAQVETGRAEVALLQAENLVQTELLRLIQQIGVQLDGAVRLTSTFAVEELAWTQDQLIGIAVDANPQLRAARATEDATNSAVRAARTAYFPSLNMSAGWSGFTRQAANSAFIVQQAREQFASQAASCQLLNQISSGLSQPLPGTPADCSVFSFTAEREALTRSRNDVFPFDFSREPFSASVTFSLPVFQGFTRERQIEEAKAMAGDARHRLRAEELRIRTEISAGYLNTITAARSVELEEQNRQLADEQLFQARERYRLGAASFIELQEAETIKARADREYLASLYSFHVALAELEALVGRPLRATGETR
jgi:outer membrane protein